MLLSFAFMLQRICSTELLFAFLELNFIDLDLDKYSGAKALQSKFIHVPKVPSLA